MATLSGMSDDEDDEEVYAAAAGNRKGSRTIRTRGEKTMKYNLHMMEKIRLNNM
jgi:hypothetical protein